MSCSRVFPEKLFVLWLVQILPAINGTRLFITIFLRARNLFISWAILIHSTTFNFNFWKLHFNTILSFKPMFSKCPFSSHFCRKVHVARSIHVWRMPRPSLYTYLICIIIPCEEWRESEPLAKGKNSSSTSQKCSLIVKGKTK